MRSLVTGGCGFIGSHMVERLLKEGHEVIVIDNFSTGRKDNLKDCQENKNLSIYEADICDYQMLQSKFIGVDWVFHLAALADIVPSVQKPEAYFHANVEGTFSVLQAAKYAGVRRFMYSASSSCYGIPGNFPTDENEKISPEYPYALTKRMGEELVLHWGKVYNMPVVTLRLFNVYGTRSRTSGTYGAVFGVFLSQKLAGKPFTVVGDGSQTRDFTYVTDVVDAFYKAAISDVCGEVFNIGSSHTYSIKQLVELLGGDVVHIPRRPGEPTCTFANISKAKRMLQWEPKITLSAGVANMLKEIEYWREAPVWTPASIEEATVDWFKYLGK